jgi:NADPH-dependent curcumin reductase CurA
VTAATNRQWLLARRPKGLVCAEDFTWSESPAPPLADGEVLVRNLYASCDPTQRSWMAGKTYLPPVKIGEVMRSFGLGEVVASNDPRFEIGQVVYGMLGWQDYCATPAAGFFPLLAVPKGVSHEAALGVFGLTGLTAYFGVVHVGSVRPGQTVVVSGAAGATGSIAGQIARALGARVVGIAGGPEKCATLKDVFGFHEAIDYKNDNVMTRLRETCPQGVHVFFDNVGGRILDAVLLHLALHARVVVCGSISGYNDETPPEGPRNYMQLVVKRSRMEGFLMTDFNDRIPEAIAALSGWVREGRLRHQTDVVDGLENAPAALARLFTGANRGKQVVRIATSAAPTEGIDPPRKAP